MRTGAVIAAAGMSSRMGAFKPLMKIGEITIIEQIIITFQRAGIDTIVVVTGNKAELVEKQVRHMGVSCILNEEYEHTQMLESAKIGLEYIQMQCDRVFFVPVDIPLFQVATVTKLLEREEMIVSPCYRDKGGHPLLLDSQVIDDILEYQGENGLKGALRSKGRSFCRVEVDDPGILYDADTQEDYKKLVELHRHMGFRPGVKVVIAQDEVFFGPGIAQLLLLIEATNSVRTACTQMNLSYSKAWKIINKAEEYCRYPIVIRQQGGAGGGGACLTEEGKQFLRQYRQYEKAVKQEAERLFRDYFVQ